MAKTITSPVEKWPGEVVLTSPLTMPQVAAWEDASDQMTKHTSRAGRELAMLPGIFACVKEWHLGGGFPERPTENNFPTGPIVEQTRLVVWLIDEIRTLYIEAVEIPNA